MAYPGEKGMYCFKCMAILPYSITEDGKKKCKACGHIRTEVKEAPND